MIINVICVGKIREVHVWVYLTVGDFKSKYLKKKIFRVFKRVNLTIKKVKSKFLKETSHIFSKMKLLIFCLCLCVIIAGVLIALLPFLPILKD
jgi:hypothetical protein